MVTNRNIDSVIHVLKRTIRQWEEPVVGRYRDDPFTTLISCLLSLRTKDAVTHAASRRLFQLARTPRRMLALSPGEITDAINIKKRKKNEAVCPNYKEVDLNVGKQEEQIQVRYYKAEDLSATGLIGWTDSVCVTAGGGPAPAPPSPAFAPYPNSSTSGINTYPELRAAVIDFTYGKDAFDEDGNSVTDENRSVVLGDIFHSTPIVVGQPGTRLSSEPGYTDFRAAYVNRDRVVYVGANDGIGVGAEHTGIAAAKMIHAGTLKREGRYGYAARIWGRDLHNIWVQILAEFGLVGSFFVLWLLVDFWRRNSALRKPEFAEYWAQSTNDLFKLNVFAVGLEGAMVAFITTGLFYNQLYQIWFYSLLLVNMLLYIHAKPPRYRNKRKVRGAVTAVH